MPRAGALAAGAVLAAWLIPIVGLVGGSAFGAAVLLGLAIAHATDPLQLDTSTSERLSKNSDYRIYVNASNTVSVFKGASSTPLAPGAELTAIVSAVTTNTALKDVREGDNVRLVTVDASLIKTALDSASISDNVGSNDGLLLYVADTSNGTSVSTNIVDSISGSSTTVTSNG